MASVRTSVPGSGYGSVFVDALIWGGTAWDSAGGPITYHFGTQADLAAAQGVHSGGVITLQGAALANWSSAERQAFLYALDLFSSVSGLTFEAATSVTTADIAWWQAPFERTTLGVHETPSATSPQIWGLFNSGAIGSWGYFAPGGAGLTTIIHELGHAVGLAHPHDGGGADDGTLFPGVDWPWGDVGDRGLNQGVATVMSYNVGYDLASESKAFGGAAGLGALDIAALQALYGANLSTRTGNDVYRLPMANVLGTGWSSIWDAGGIDTISGAGARTNVTIDLRAATLKLGSAGAAGFISQAGVIGGGFTIAKGVVIENAIGGAMDDRLIGNAADNVLNGGAGADRMMGGRGNDTYIVNSARDVVRDGGGRDTVLASASYALASSARIEVLAALDRDGTKALALTGSASANRITGNAGSNVLNGKGGNDVLTGGAGPDAFVFDTALNSRTNADRITDFSARQDTIRLEDAVFTGLAGPGVLAAGAFRVATTSTLAQDVDDRIIYQKGTGWLYYDPDGIGGAGATRFAHIGEGLRLKADVFFVV